MKKALSVLLTFAIICSIITVPAMASTTSNALPEGYVEAYEYFHTEFDDAALPTVPSGYSKDTWMAIKNIDGDSVLEFGYENAGSTVDKFYTPTITNRNATGTNALENLNDVVFEYRFRYNPENTERGTYFSSYAEEDPYAATVFMAARSYGLADSIAWKHLGSTPVASFDSMAKWHTISIVYPADGTKTRRLYVDGVDYGTSTDDKITISKVEVDNIWANTWGRTGKTRWYLRSYSAAKISEYYLDYVKAYEKPSHFIAEIENPESVARDSIVLSFNNAFGAETVNSSAFTVTDGTNTIKSSGIERLAKDKIKVIFEDFLSKNTDYTLNISGVKDNLATALYNTSLEFTTNAADLDLYTEEELYYYNGFEGTDPGLDYYLTVGEVDYGNTVSNDGKSVFRVQGLDVHQNGGNPDFRTPSVSFSKFEAPSELMLEYRIRLTAPNEDSYLGVWTTDKRSKTAAFGRYADTKDKVFFHYLDKTPASEDFTVDTSKWTTVTIAYPNDVQKRKLYVNGTYIGESPEGARENTFASVGETALTFLTDFKSPEDVLEVDYVKYYKKSVTFAAKIIDVKPDGVTVEFNSTPANLTAENISFSDGTGVFEIKELNEKKYIIVPSEDLSTGDVSLNLSNVKDTAARSIESGVFEIKVENSEEKVYTYSTFNEATLPKGFSNRNAIYAPYNNLVDGKLQAKFHTNGVDYFNVNKITNPNATAENPKADLPVLVLEYKAKFEPADTDGQTYVGYEAESGVQTDMIFFGATSYSYASPKTGNELKWKRTSAKEDVIGYVDDYTDWHTYAIEYSNTANVRSLYVDGEYKGTSPVSDAATSNQWYSSGSAFFTFKLYDAGLNGEANFEYIKAYTPADNISAEITSISADSKTVYVDFSGNMAKVEPGMFVVAGIPAEAVEVSDFDNQIYAVKFAERIPVIESPSLAINGAVSTLGKKYYDVIDIDVRQAEEFELNVICENSEVGIVSVNGNDGTVATVTEGTDVAVNVKTKINYTAKVTQDGKTLEPDKAGNYMARRVTPDTEIKVSFAETVFVSDLPKNKIPTIGETYSHGTATWAFASLRKEANEYGFVIAKNRKELESASEVQTALTNGTATKIQATKINSLGEYGLLIMDKNNKFEGQYYVVPYATYDVGTIYGTPVFAGHKR